MRCIKNKQNLIRFYVDDLVKSFESPKVNDKFHKWLNKMYGQHSEITTTQGPKHEFLGQLITFKDHGIVEINMSEYVKQIIEELPVNFNKENIALTPASDTLYNLGTGRRVENKEGENFHQLVAIGLYGSKKSQTGHSKYNICIMW